MRGKLIVRDSPESKPKLLHLTQNNEHHNLRLSTFSMQRSAADIYHLVVLSKENSIYL